MNLLTACTTFALLFYFGYLESAIQPLYHRDNTQQATIQRDAIQSPIYTTVINDSSSGSKEQLLITHVKKSIENAEKEVSKLNKELLNIEGFSSSKIRHFLNNICSLKGASYLEIGCWKGSTLLAATYKNEDNLSCAVAIDNWSQFGGPKNEFFQNVNSYIPNIPLKFYETNCFSIDKSQVFDRPVQIYFYDGGYRFEEQKAAFTFYDSIFDDVFIAIVDDWNWEVVREGTLAAFRELEYQILYECPLFTAGNGDTSSWWNGLYVAVIKKYPISKKDSSWETWTDAQIEKDFAPFEKTGVSLDMLDQTCEWNAKWHNIAYSARDEGMVRYRVIDSQIYQLHHKTHVPHYGLAGRKVLEEIVKRFPLPDVDFIFFDQDGPIPSDLDPEEPFVAPDGSKPLAPIFSGTKREGYKNIILYHDHASPIRPGTWDLFALSYSWPFVIKAVEEGVTAYPWETKIPKLFWRGRPTDRWCNEITYRESPRVGMVLLSQQYPDLLDIAFSELSFLNSLKEFPPIQPFASTQDHLRYKYQVCVDGYAGQYPGFAWRLLSNCLVFKVESPVKLWFDAGLVPGFHYILIKHDLSNLVEQTIWAQEHDEDARIIAEKGRMFAKENIMPEDVIRYCYKVLLKYASLQRFIPTAPSPSESEFELVSSPLTERDRALRKEFLQKQGIP